MNFSDLNNLDLKDIINAPAPVRVIAYLLIFVLIVGLGWYFVWSDALNNLDSKRKEEEVLRGTYTNKKTQAYHYEAYKRRLSEIEKSLASMLRQLPNRSEMDALLTDINQVGVGRGLLFELFKPGSEVPADFYATLPVDLRVTGSYPDIGGFVSDLSKLPRIVTVHDINLSPVKEGGNLNMTARIQTYRYLDDDEMAARKKKSGPKGKKK